MFRKALYILPFFAISLPDAEARPRGNQPLMRVLIQDVDLTDDQKIAFFDMKQDNIEERSDKTKKRQGKKAIVNYAMGNLSAEAWHAQIDENASERLEKHLSKMEALHDILETYSADQKEQVIDNLTAWKGKPNRAKKQRKRGQRLKKMTKELNLTDSQSALLKELKDHRQFDKENRKTARKEKRERLMMLIDGTESLRTLKQKMKREHKDRLDARHDQVDIWIELIDSLDDDQRALFATKFNARKGKQKRR